MSYLYDYESQSVSASFFVGAHSFIVVRAYTFLVCDYVTMWNVEGSGESVVVSTIQTVTV